MFEALGHYKILDRIGAGGLGDVYRGRDTRLGRTVAIKVLSAALSDDADRRERLLRDARATAVLSHPNIAALYEIGEDQGHLFLVFEFVPGHTLKTEIGGRPMNPRRAIDLAIQIADALADAHAAGIVHRDIEPDNIIITPKGSAKILDFGLATWTAGGAERDRAVRGVTSAGTATGSVAYMSPEQARGEQVDQRTDIFSLGIVLFEMLTGKLPFEGTTSAAMTLKIMQSPAASVTSVNPSLPREIEPIVAKALAKGLDERYGSAATLAADLRAVVAALDLRSGSSESAAVGPTASPRRGRRSVAGFFWLLGAVVAALALVLYSTPLRQLLTRTWKQTLGPPPAPVIAVIPLETDPSPNFFADGLTDDLITRLGQTPGLEVLGRSATREYRGRSPRDVAHELNAAVVLTGSVRPSAETVTIRVSLIDPSDGTALWTGQYTRDAKDIFAVQAQVAEDVAQALRVKLEPTASSARAASRTVDPRAYEAYLRGRQATALRRPAEARTFYQQAIDLDDGLAEAYAGLAAALYSEPIAGPPVEASARLAAFKRAADRAYELAPDSPQANLAIGLATDRLTDRLTYLKKSIAIDPSFSEGFHQIGDQIADFDPDRAIAFYRRALVLDPRLIVSQEDMLDTLNSAGRADDAARELEAAAPEARAVLQVPFQVERALDERRYTDAVGLLARNDVYRHSPWLTLEYAGALQGAGRSQEAYDLATGLVRQHPEDCAAAATLAALTMDRKQASAARQLAAPGLSWLTAADPDATALRCAAHAAAAVGSAQAAATLLRRIGADERLFKEWSRSDLGTTGRHLLRAPRYPWTRVASLPPVIDAVRALDRTYAAARQQSAAVLADVTPSDDPPRRR